MADIFISYSREDISYARRLVAELKQAGFNVWTDTLLLAGGNLWTVELEIAIREASIFIVIVSETSRNSVWVREEINFAQENAKTIIPILVDATVTLPFGLNTSSYFVMQADKTPPPELITRLKEYQSPTIDEDVKVIKPKNLEISGKVFMSYSSKNRDFTKQIYTALKAKGIQVWLDVEEIKHGDDWADKIQEGLDECAGMILVLSPESMNSRHVSDEWKYYLNGKPAKPILPILFKDAKIHFQLKSLHYVDFTNPTNFNISLETLILGVQTVLVKSTK